MLGGETMQRELESEFESEFEDEFENEYESEYEGEEFFGNMLGEGEEEYESDYESEAFINPKKLRGLIQKLRPILKKIALPAARAVGTAIGGPAVGNTIGAIAGQMTQEGEYEYEFESEYELTSEFESEYEDEVAPQPDALAEALAAIASQVQSEAEAEAYTGAIVIKIIPSKDASIRQIYPKLVKGAATLTRTLRKYSSTRPLVKTVPTIFARAGKTLARQAAQGKPVTTKTAARIVAGETRKVLGNPMTTAKAVVRSSRAAQRIAKPAPRRRREPMYE